jgi:elongation factor Ts
MSGTEKVSMEALKELRRRSGAGVMECRRALEQAGGSLDEAERVLAARAAEKAARQSSDWTGEGFVGSYVHHTGTLGALVELGCRTDFVARTAEFRALGRWLAEQVAAGSGGDGTGGLSPVDALLAQAWIREPGKTVGELVREASLKFGEPIRVRRFVRFSLGEGS